MLMLIMPVSRRPCLFFDDHWLAGCSHCQSAANRSNTAPVLESGVRRVYHPVPRRVRLFSKKTPFAKRLVWSFVSRGPNGTNRGFHVVLECGAVLTLPLVRDGMAPL